MGNIVLKEESACQGEIVIYQPDEVTRLDVKVENDTVWLNRNQLAVLFDRDVKTMVCFNCRKFCDSSEGGG